MAGTRADDRGAGSYVGPPPSPFIRDLLAVAGWIFRDAAPQSNIWYYRFDWDEEPAPFNDIYGAAHEFDLPFIFGTFGPSLFSNIANSTANRPGRLALSGAMMESVAAFARSGDPNAPAALGVTWPIWPAKLIFDATLTDKAISVQ